MKDFGPGVFLICYDCQMRVVGCFLEFENRFVLLLRHSHKPEGDTWALPGGKVEPGETDEDAIIRELQEETGYIASAQELHRLGEYKFATSENAPYKYIPFKLKLQAPHQIKLEQSAHTEYKWLTPEECFARTDLIKDLHNLLKLVGYV